ncbi:MAG TPA: hypothetical protein VFG88_07570 [Nocardioidaceae bacterium]|jgi:hypothetical protein|nr:hypothetical protein [Nocardioidaceae bacterium]
MSVTFSGLSGRLPHLAVPPPGRPVRRVREEVRDGLVVVAFSAGASSTLAALLLLLGRLAD